MAKYIDKNGTRLLTTLIVFLVLMFTLAALDSWTIREIVKSISAEEGFILLGIFLAIYLSLFFLHQLITRKYQGWKRVIIIVCTLCGVLGGFLMFDDLSRTGFTWNIAVQGILVGILIGFFGALAAIEGTLITIGWLKEGFTNQS